MAGVSDEIVSRRRLMSANAEYQLLRSLLTNRTKRHRQGRFLIQGVRSIDSAVAAGWPLPALLVREGAGSSWLTRLVDTGPVGEVVVLPGDLLDGLSQREDGAEAVAVGAMVAHDLGAAGSACAGPLVIAEGVQSPGNLGTILRSAHALGAAGVVVTGHAADPYDPQAVRASTGSLFRLPFGAATSVGSAADDQAAGRRLVGLDPAGDPIDDVDLSGPLALVAGTESTGLSRRARERCDALASIPMVGDASSLNVATATAVALAEVARRTRARGH
jgi:23S rRNA (uridine2479-2'-O)-methyltransferase